MNKKKITMISTIVITVLILLIGVSFAYYNARINENNKTQTLIKTKELELVFTGKNEITADNMIAGDSFTKKFTVENKSVEEVSYNIYMQDIYSEFDKYLVYKLEDEDGEVIPFSNVPATDVKYYLVADLKIGAKETKEYTLTIMFEYVEENQIAYAGKEFRATVGIDTKNLTGIVIHNEKISLQEVTTSITHKFKVENYDNFASQYDISLEDIVNDYGDNLTYSLIKNGEEIITNETMPTEDTLILENVLIAANTVDYYEMIVVYNSKVAKLLKNDIKLLSTDNGFGAIITTKKDKKVEDVTVPVLASISSTYDSIVAEYSAGDAKTGVKDISCELTDENGDIKSTGTLNGDNCEFTVDATKENTTYYVRKCITSNYDVKECSELKAQENVGYCTEGNYTTSTASTCLTYGSCSKTCGGGTQYATKRTTSTYTSNYNSLSCGSSYVDTAKGCSKSCNTQACYTDVTSYLPTEAGCECTNANTYVIVATAGSGYCSGTKFVSSAINLAGYTSITGSMGVMSGIATSGASCSLGLDSDNYSNDLDYTIASGSTTATSFKTVNINYTIPAAAKKSMYLKMICSHTGANASAYGRVYSIKLNK